MNLWPIIIAAGIPSAITSFLFWLLKKELTKAESRREEQEESTEKLIRIIMNVSHSTNILAEATAKAV